MPPEQEAAMAEKLTPRQRQVLEAVEAFIQQHEMPPTRAELARVLGITSHNGAHEHLLALQKKGFLKLLPGVSRGIRLQRTLA